MLIIIYIFMLLSGMIIKNNKLFFIVQLLFIFLLMAGNTWNADYDIYRNGYENFELRSDKYEWLFYLFVNFCNKIGMSYEWWRTLVSFLYVSIIGITIYILGDKKKNFVLSMVMFFPIFMDTVQIRQTCAYIIGVLALLVLFKSNNKKTFIIGTLILALAGGLHASAYLYLLCLPAFIIKRNKSSIIFSVIIAIVFFVLNSWFLDIAGFFFSQEKIDTVANVASRYESDTVMRKIILLSMLSFIYVIPYIYKKYLLKLYTNSFEDTLYKINFMIVVPLIYLVNYDVDFYRVGQILVVFNLIGILSLFAREEEIGVISKNNLYIELYSSSLLFGCLFLLVLVGNYDTVYSALFNFNKFF